MQAQGMPQEEGAVVNCHLMQGSIATFIGRVSQALVTLQAESKARVPALEESTLVGVPLQEGPFEDLKSELPGSEVAVPEKVSEIPRMDPVILWRANPWEEPKARPVSQPRAVPPAASQPRRN